MSAYIDLRTDLQSPIGWSYDLATRASKILGRNGPPEEYKHLSSKRWAYCDVLEVVEHNWETCLSHHTRHQEQNSLLGPRPHLRAGGRGTGSRGCRRARG